MKEIYTKLIDLYTERSILYGNSKSMPIIFKSLYESNFKSSTGEDWDSFYPRFVQYAYDNNTNLPCKLLGPDKSMLIYSTPKHVKRGKPGIKGVIDALARREKNGPYDYICAKKDRVVVTDGYALIECITDDFTEYVGKLIKIKTLPLLGKSDDCFGNSTLGEMIEKLLLKFNCTPTHVLKIEPLLQDLKGQMQAVDMFVKGTISPYTTLAGILGGYSTRGLYLLINALYANGANDISVWTFANGNAYALNFLTDTGARAAFMSYDINKANQDLTYVMFNPIETEG